MTDPTDDELNAAVAKAAQCLTSIFYRSGAYHNNYLMKVEDSWMRDSFKHPAKNWNALMAAVAKLEETHSWFAKSGNYRVFCRDVQTWEVGNSDLGEIKCDFKEGNSESEARALALCVYAVVNQ